MKIALRRFAGTFWTRLCLVAGAVWLSACGGVFIPAEGRTATRTAQAIDTLAVQTVEALRVAEEATLAQGSRETATPTRLPATATPLPTATPWPAPVRVEVSIDTNCRSGPAPSFPMIGALMVGESTVVRAKLLDLDYWVVENPDNPGRECWLWGKHATLDGDTTHLPIATPPWTPTPLPGTIAGWAYIDTNQNWTRDDPGDSPIDGVRITVRVGDCPGGSSVAMVETNGQGRYRITGLVPTLYCVSREAVEILNPNTWTIYLSPGQTRDEINFWRSP